MKSTSSPPRRRYLAFTLIELLVVISIIALLIGILLPALGAARRTTRQMQNGTQVRGIHQAMVIFAQGNNSYYPGYNRDGARESGHTFRTTDGVNTVQAVGYAQAADPAYRFRRLAEDGHFAGEYMISPSETKKKWAAGPVTTSNFSYSQLIQPDPTQPTTTGGQDLIDEHRETSNTLAVVLCDRLLTTGSGASLIQRSVHSNPKSGTDWKGSVGWNDNHVSFEPDYTVDTKFRRSSNTDDNLFADAGTARENDAVMVYNDWDDSIDESTPSPATPDDTY